MAGQTGWIKQGMLTQALRRGVALGLCTTLLPFTQLDLLAQQAAPQQSQYPYQDPAEQPSAQPQYPQQQYPQQAPPYAGQGQPADGNGPAGPPPGYGQGEGAYGQPGGAPPPQGGTSYGPTYTPQGPQDLERLVAPIALYPDSLVAQVLAASTYPQQVTEADQWMQQYGGQPPAQLAQSVNQMPWDPSVKALTQFPTVLQQLARSNQWTIALGNAYYNQPADVMAAVQSMRYRAREAGKLQDTPQQVVVEQGPEIIIQPANPEVVYVPYYDPWVVYGAPIAPYYGFYRPAPPPGLVIGLGIGFAVGVGVGIFAHYGWGYHAWAPNWRSNTIIVNHNTYISNSTTVINRGGYGAYNQGFGRSGPQNFSHASFNRSAPLYNGRPMSAMNRPAAAPAGNFNRPGQPGAGFNRPGQPNALNRPAAGNNGFNRPAATPGAYNRPVQQGAGAYTRPAPNSNAGAYNRPPQQGSGAYNRPSPNAGGNRPAPQVQHSQGGHPAAQAHPSGGGEHHGGGGEHHK